MWSTVTSSYHDELKERLERVYNAREALIAHPEKILYRMPKHIFSIDKSEMKTEEE